MKAPTVARLRELLTYDQDTGEFRWLVSRGRTAQAGSRAGTRFRDGRMAIKVDGVLYYSSRLAVLYMTGAFPPECVDHRDGNLFNNAWANLRICSHGENMQNKLVSKRNKSGLIGVSKHGDAWQATICVNKHYRHLGRFSTAEAAHAAYVAAKRELHGFNPEVRYA